MNEQPKSKTAYETFGAPIGKDSYIPMGENSPVLPSITKASSETVERLGIDLDNGLGPITEQELGEPDKFSIPTIWTNLDEQDRQVAALLNLEIELLARLAPKLTHGDLLETIAEIEEKRHKITTDTAYRKKQFSLNSMLFSLSSSSKPVCSQCNGLGGYPNCSRCNNTLVEP